VVWAEDRLSLMGRRNQWQQGLRQSQMRQHLKLLGHRWRHLLGPKLSLRLRMRKLLHHRERMQREQHRERHLRLRQQRDPERKRQ
jgi:hypothetical protein